MILTPEVITMFCDCRPLRLDEKVGKLVNREVPEWSRIAGDYVQNPTPTSVKQYQQPS